MFLDSKEYELEVQNLNEVNEYFRIFKKIILSLKRTNTS